MAKTYAWTKFVVERNEWGQDVNVVAVGNEVTQKQLNVDDDAWAELLATGAVRETPYPEDVPLDMSPQEHVQKQVAAGEMTADEGNKVLGAEPAAEETPAEKPATTKK